MVNLTTRLFFNLSLTMVRCPYDRGGRVSTSERPLRRCRSWPIRPDGHGHATRPFRFYKQETNSKAGSARRASFTGGRFATSLPETSSNTPVHFIARDADARRGSGAGQPLSAGRFPTRIPNAVLHSAFPRIIETDFRRSKRSSGPSDSPAIRLRLRTAQRPIGNK